MAKFTIQKRLVLVFVFLTSLAISIYRIFVILDNMETYPSANDVSYYLASNKTTQVFGIITAVLIVVFIFAAIFLSRKIQSTLIYGEPSIIFTSSLSGFLIIGCTFYYVFYFVNDKSDVTFLVAAILITALLSAVYFLLSTSEKSKRKISAWLSLAPIGFYTLRLLNDFIRQSTTHNPFSSTYLLLSLVAFLLFFLAEGKFRVKTGNITLYLVFGFLAILLSLIYSLPTLFLSAFWLFPTNYTMLYSAIDLTVVMYISARISQLKCIDLEYSDTSLSLNQS